MAFVWRRERVDKERRNIYSEMLDEPHTCPVTQVGTPLPLYSTITAAGSPVSAVQRGPCSVSCVSAVQRGPCMSSVRQCF